MKKMIIAALVGGLILFFWQFFSWSMLNIHGAETSYSANQDAVLECLKSSGLQPGHYMMPTVAPGTSQEAQQAAMNNFIGKPWALVSYHSAFSMDMGMNMARGFVVDFLAVLLLSWILLKVTDLDFKTTLLASLAIGFIGYLTIPYLNHIWFDTPSMGYLIDSVVGWGVTGAWLGWWLTRK